MDGMPRRRDARRIWASPRCALDLEAWDTPGGSVERPVLRHPGSVVILAEPEPGRMLLVRQWRYPLARWTLEVPAGTCQPGEDPAATAARELAEETGYRAGRLRPLFRFWPAPGVSDELMIVFLAEDLAAGTAQPDAGELIGPRLVARDEAARLASAGEIADAKTLLALSWWGIQWCGP